MTRPVLYFAHANGFPARCYGALLEALAARFRIGYVETLGTDPRYPVTERWPHLVEQLEHAIEREFGGAPVCGVGHSLGGYLTFLAAVRRPELFRAIVLLDAPIIGALRGRMLGATKRLGIVDRVTPAGATRERRAEWASREDAKAHFRSRRLFRDFSEACLEDYVSHALVASRGRLHLRIPPGTEYQIYRTIPHDMSRYLGALAVPAGFIGGARSDVVRRVGLAAMRRRFVLRKVPGGHLFPFEHPAEAARALDELLDELAAHGPIRR
ncbi:MAG: alpha/beta hydrolase [Betaproteobacteria bacterium]|nr:alpha/beta hydrolase [Betaproteobacteria bacterium]